MITFHLTEKKNLDSIMKHGLLPKKGKRSSKIEEEKLIFLFPSYQDFEDGFTNWMEKEFDEEEELVLLKIEIPEERFIVDTGVEWELAYSSTIPAHFIEFYEEV